MAERKQFLLDEMIGPRDALGKLIPLYADTGLGTRPRDHFMTGFGMPDPTKWHTYFNDFDSLAEFNGITATATWASNSTGTTPTFALTAIDGGCGLITLSAADDDRQFFQTKVASFLLAAGKQAFFKARFKVSDATQSDFVMGLQVLDTTPLAVSDGVWFQKDDGDAFLDFHVASASTQTDATAVATVVADTFLSVGWYYDGVSKIYYAVNDVTLGYVAATNVPLVANTVSFGLQNGEAVAKTMTIDYLFAANQR